MIDNCPQNISEKNKSRKKDICSERAIRSRFVIRQISRVQRFSLVLATVVLLLSSSGALNCATTQNHGIVTGRVVSTGGTFGAGTIAFFRADAGSDPADRSILRIPERTALVNEQGRFAVKIQFGNYFLGYFPEEQKTDPGLPDKSFTPFLAGANERNKYLLNVSVQETDIGDIKFYPYQEKKLSPSFTVEGIVKSESGKPMRGISIVAKSDLNSFRPQYISQPTDRSGQFTIHLPPGRFYLLARHRLSKYGRPGVGEYFGILGVDGPAGEFGWFPMNKDQDYALEGKSGQIIKNADITVFRIPDPIQQEERLRLEGRIKSGKKK